MFKSFLTVLMVTVFCAAAIVAQQPGLSQTDPSRVVSGIGVMPAVSPFSLLDASRVTWSHSYSVSYFSGGIGSGSAGLLNSMMLYEFSPKLTLVLNIGVLHNTGALWGQGEYDVTLLPGFRLDYRPSDNVHMSVSFQTYSGYLSPGIGRGYYRRFGSLFSD